MNKEHRTKNAECRITSAEPRATRHGFSLTEVLIAVGILAVGMAFVAGAFPTGIYLTTVATERTIAAVAADEAFAKIRIYAIGDLNDMSDDIKLEELRTNVLKPDELTDFNDIFPAIEDANCNEFLYPSTDTDESEKQYCWSALFRRTDANDRLVQVTVFVSRKVSPNLEYPDPDGSGTVAWPRPVKVGVGYADDPPTNKENRLRITSRAGASGDKTFINDGYTIVDDATGRIYRVLERYKAPADDTILLDRNWDDSPPGGTPQSVWVVPPPVGGGRYPCIAVYQKLIRF